MMPFSIDLSLGEIIKNPLILWLIVIILLLKIIFDCVKNIPAFLKLKAIFYLPLANWLKFKILQKEAIRSDIQGTINYAISPIIQELPSGSIKPLEITYINKVKAESFIREGKIFVRIRPVENEDNNFMSVTQLYLEMALIPEAKKFLSLEQVKSVTYFTTKRLVEGRKTLINKLHDEYYLPDTKKYPQLKNYFEKIEKVDNRGLFFSILISTLERGASILRFRQGNLQQEFDKVLEHLLAFIDELKKKPPERDKNVWIYTHHNIPFAILLVASPYKAFSVDPITYVKRLKEDLKSADWIFVVFSRAEWEYGKRVIDAIEVSGVVELADSCESWKDYRGAVGGVVKLYVKKDRLKRY